ncbi:aminoglycoside phosphotransferase family protein [Aliiroseovarius marinus]|uniref:aminoglycoside phosphotransferase family protein n=1 Tax=Aliiroseovarius marinus TaxID=2500159 RepID=UPI003D7E73EE
MTTSPRQTEIDGFLKSAGWNNAQRIALTGDASTRLYERLIRNDCGSQAILMNAAPEIAGSQARFVEVTQFLADLGLSAPSVLHQDLARGLLLLEDLGDALFANLTHSSPEIEPELYEAATDVIHHLHSVAAPEDLPDFGPQEMAEAIDLVFLWYRDGGADVLTESDQKATASLAQLLSGIGSFDWLSLRDYHAENLIWLPTRKKLARVGLLDYQDAVRTHRLYDLVSLIRDARRDVPDALATHLIHRFADKISMTREEAERQVAIIAVQRNLRILGVFARLSLRDGKAGYTDLLPRVWRHLQHDLSHPALAGFSETLSSLPAPTPSHLATLVSK